MSEPALDRSDVGASSKCIEEVVVRGDEVWRAHVNAVIHVLEEKYV